MTESTKVNEFLRLIMANQKPIYALILGMIPNRDDAEDIFQETVLVMWSKFDSFERGTSAVSKKLVSHFVIPAKAGIRVFDPGFRIKSGMT